MQLKSFNGTIQSSIKPLKTLTIAHKFFDIDDDGLYLMTKQMKMKKFSIYLQKSPFSPHRLYKKKLPNIFCQENHKNTDTPVRLEHKSYDILIDGLMNSTFKTERHNTTQQHFCTTPLKNRPVNKSNESIERPDPLQSVLKPKLLRKKIIIRPTIHLDHQVKNAINDFKKISSSWNTLLTKVHAGYSWINTSQSTLNQGKNAYNIFKYDLQRLTRSMSCDMRVSLYGQRFNKN